MKVQVNLDPGSQLIGDYFMILLLLLLLLQSNEYINIQNILAPTDSQSSHHYSILL